MDNQTEVIRQQMEDTRHSLQDKLESLEEQVKSTVQEATDTVATVKETVEAVKDTVKESVESVQGAVHTTVQSVKDSLNVERHIREHPWAMFAGAAAVGFVSGRLVGSMAGSHSHQAAHERAPFSGTPYEPTQASFSSPSPLAGQRDATNGAKAARGSNGFSAASATEPKKSWLDSFTAHFGDEIDKVKSLAIGAVGGVIREMVTHSAPSDSWIKSRKWSITSPPSSVESQWKGRFSLKNKQLHLPRRESPVTTGMKQKWEGRWEQLKGKAKKAWGDITDDELLRVEGDYEELVGTIKTQTGESREATEDRLNPPET